VSTSRENNARGFVRQDLNQACTRHNTILRGFSPTFLTKGFYERASTTKGRIKEKHIKDKEEIKTRKTNEHTKRTEKVKGTNCVRSSRDRGMEKERGNHTREFVK
jgi:hypothetical protein